MQPAAHIPVLIDQILRLSAPISGTWVDGTFGNGGYSRALVAAGADNVIGIDQDPNVIKDAEWVKREPSITLLHGRFGDMVELLASEGLEEVDGVVLDIGVSSMQIDQAGRGFSFAKDGPLDMRMSQTGPSAADLINTFGEAELADILFLFGEERASRRIAKRIVDARPLTRTLELAELIEGALPRPKPGQVHPATRSFQALRIAVNAELDQLVQGLAAAEHMLRPGGQLVVVSFHSLEDRIVKRFFQSRSKVTASGSRYAPAEDLAQPSFKLTTRKAVEADETEISANPRARSAKLRIGRRTEGRAHPIDLKALGVPQMKGRAQ
ncbi:MAG: 16S rRNA (cytosine(1402)-N(4))-methyltransferase RsmH [Pseudomonadota bacterium]